MKRGRGYNKMGYLDKIFLVPLHSLCNIKITKSFHYEPRFNVFCFFFQETTYLEKLDGVYVVSVKKNIGFRYLLTKILLSTLILLEMNIFLKKYYTKSKINQSITTYLEYNLMI